MTFDQLLSQWTWKPIRGCPGRFVLTNAPDRLEPRDLVGEQVALSEFQVAAARDTVVIARLERGGLISYRRNNGTYVHTVNTADGFSRKLQQLNITLTEKGVGAM